MNESESERNESEINELMNPKENSAELTSAIE